MLLTGATLVMIVNKEDGSLSEMTLNGWMNALQGGSRWEDVIVTTSKEIAKDLSMRHEALAKARKMLESIPSVSGVLAAVFNLETQLRQD